MDAASNLPRPYIFGLPDELLLDIFEFLEVVDPISGDWINCNGAADIKNTRLVCRRFCEVSSQLLARIVCLQFNKASLARLDEISRHPTIAKGVRTIRVVLHFYNRSFVSLDRFGRYHARILGRQIKRFIRDWERHEASRVPEKVATGLVAEGKAVVETLRQLVSFDNGVQHWISDQDHRARLHEIHREYVNRLEEQESLLESGDFFRLVGAIIARMPAARKLEFMDFAFKTIEKYILMVPGRDVWGAVQRLTLQPMNGHDAKRNFLELPNYQCVVRVIDAVRSAGASLNTIDIRLTNSGHPGSLAPAPDIRQSFSSGMQKLQEFYFLCGDGGFTERNVDHLEAFLSACLDTPSLQMLHLDLGWRKRDSETIDLGRVLGLSPRPNLTTFFTSRVGIHLPALVLFLERLPESPGIIYFQTSTHLLSGTWKEALDLFRRKTAYVSYLGGTFRGAECDAMPLEDMRRIFSHNKSHRYRSLATLYISNEFPRMLNPFQAYEDGIDLAELLDNAQ